MSKLEQLEQEAALCKECALNEGRTNVVFGEGHPNGHIFLIGEGPGYYEDIQGRPFVGRSGKLLDQILEACGFNRKEHVYIGNIVKCRPPNNRVPASAEKETCLPYLYQQIELVNPEIIVLLGATALNGLIDKEMKIGQVRGTWIHWNNRLVMPTYHPSALLRNKNLKYRAWEDFKTIVQIYRERVNPDHYSEHV